LIGLDGRVRDGVVAKYEANELADNSRRREEPKRKSTEKMHHRSMVLHCRRQ